MRISKFNYNQIGIKLKSSSSSIDKYAVLRGIKLKSSSSLTDKYAVLNFITERYFQLFTMTSQNRNVLIDMFAIRYK